MPTPSERFERALRENAPDFGVALDDRTISQLCDYYEILLKWNDRLHLVAPCSPEELAVRHILESLMLLPCLRPSARLVDVGSGAGLPAIPCLIARPDVTASLIESSPRKAVFLREAARHLNLQSRANVIASRFEELRETVADVVTCRALDRCEEMLPKLIEWMPPSSTFALFGSEALREKLQTSWPSVRTQLIPKSERRFLMIIER